MKFLLGVVVGAFVTKPAWIILSKADKRNGGPVLKKLDEWTYNLNQRINTQIIKEDVR
jgi:hypothetical protein